MPGIAFGDSPARFKQLTQVPQILHGQSTCRVLKAREAQRKRRSSNSLHPSTPSPAPGLRGLARANKQPALTLQAAVSSACLVFPAPSQSPKRQGSLRVYQGREAGSCFQCLFLPKYSSGSQTWALPVNVTRPGTLVPVVFRLERAQG